MTDDASGAKENDGDRSRR